VDASFIAAIGKVNLYTEGNAQSECLRGHFLHQAHCDAPPEGLS
jgi:hypothetical protein